MRAMRIHKFDGPDALSLDEVAEPVAETGEVLVDVSAVGIGFVDLLLSKGRYQVKPPLPFPPASEIVGRRRDTGERVVGVAWHRGLADVVTLPNEAAHTIPDAMTDDQAAALPVNYQTSHLALKVRGRMSPGETVLVHGAAGGVGTAAIQIARAIGASRIIATASTEERRAVALACGADLALSPEDDWIAITREATGGTGVDLVFDPVGGALSTSSFKAMGRDARLLVVGFASGTIPEVRYNRLLLNHHEVVGVNFSQTTHASARAAHADLVAWFLDGHLDPVIAGVYDLEDAAEAYRLFESRAVIGKPVVRMRRPA